MEQPVTAVYDANVLYPAPLRDLLIRLAYQAISADKTREAEANEWCEALSFDPVDSDR